MQKKIVFATDSHLFRWFFVAFLNHQITNDSVGSKKRFFRNRYGAVRLSKFP